MDRRSGRLCSMLPTAVRPLRPVQAKAAFLRSRRQAVEALPVIVSGNPPFPLQGSLTRTRQEFPFGG